MGRAWATLAGALLLAALGGGAARAEPPPAAGDLPPPPPPPPEAMPIGPVQTEEAQHAPAPVAPAHPPKPQNITTAPRLETTTEARNRAIADQWGWVAGGGTLFAVNYSYMILLAEVGLQDNKEPPPELKILYVPVVGPFIALARGDLDSTDAMPLPIIASLFQAFGLGCVIWGIALPIPDAAGAGAALTVTPGGRGASLSMAGRW